MNVYYDYKKLSLKKPVVTMGVFDGVHRGHRMLLNRVIEEALRKGTDSVAVTFDPHPRIVLDSNAADLRFLTDIDERISLLGGTGIGHLVIIPFTRELSNMTAPDFLENVLCRYMDVSHLVTGFNHHFGKRHKGTSETMLECAGKMDFTVTREEALTVDGVAVSSSVIRQMIMGGDVEKAASLLGYDYFITGRVVSGRKIGRNIGFPTANIEPLFSHKLIPGDGVYAVEVEIDGFAGRHMAMLNIGSRPTVKSNDGHRSIEAHILDFDGDLYGSKVRVYFRYRIRDEMMFANMDALASQLAEDRQKVIKLFAR